MSNNSINTNSKKKSIRSLKKKSHYFIGHKIQFQEELQHAINNYIQHIKENANIHSKHIIGDEHTRFIYLGYLDEETANELINNKLKPILEYIVSKLNNKIQDGTYTTECIIDPQLVIDGHKRTYNKIQMVYSNSLIEEKIVPILRKITESIYGKYEYKFTPHVNIMSIDIVKEKNRKLYEDKMKYYGIELPRLFNINSIDILKATTLEHRVGRSSKNDESRVDIVATFDLKKSNKVVKTPDNHKEFINNVRSFFSK